MKDFTLGTMYWLNPKYSTAEFEADILAMQENQFNLVRTIIWWELIEEFEGSFDFGYVDRFFAAAEKYGMKLMPTIGFYPPFWLTVKLDGEGKNDPGRYPSLERPEVKEPLARMIKAVVERYRHSPVLEYWNIWNEPTLNSTLNQPMLEKFTAWLLQSYPTIELLREAWRGEYPVFGLLCPPNREGLTPAWLEVAFRLGDRGRATPIRYDWYRFLGETLCGQLQWLHHEVKKYDSIHPTHTNIHSLGWNPCGAGRDTFMLAQIPDTISSSIHPSNDYPGGKELCDRIGNYSCSIDQTFSWTKGRKTAMVGELQIGTSDTHARQYTPTPETVRYELWRSIGAGLDGLIYWEWQAWRAGTFELGEFGLRGPADGAPNDRSREIELFGKIYGQNRDVLTRMTRPVSRIAILESQETSIFRYLSWLDHKGVDGIGNESQFALFGCFRALSAANYQVDFVSEAEVEAGLPPHYAVLYLPGITLLNGRLAAAITRYIHNGGAVWADGRLAFVDEHMYVRKQIPGHGLAEVFGAKEADFIAQPTAVTLTTENGAVARGLQMEQRLASVGGTVTAHFQDGYPAVIDNVWGKGRTRLVGAQLSQRLREYDDRETAAYIAGFAAECGVEPLAELPAGITCRRLDGPQGDFLLIVFNSSATERQLEIPHSRTSAYAFYREVCLSGPVMTLLLQPQETEILYFS